MQYIMYLRIPVVNKDDATVTAAEETDVVAPIEQLDEVLLVHVLFATARLCIK